MILSQVFLSTLSLRRATLYFSVFNLLDLPFLSTLSLRRATSNCAIYYQRTSDISIHALLAESDWLRCWQLAAQDISIHALLAESDAETAHERADSLAFLSTLSLRRATKTSIAGRITSNDFYPRSPCGERRCSLILQ